MELKSSVISQCCNQCGIRKGSHTLFIGCCDQSIVHVTCVTQSQCANCNASFPQYINQYVDKIRCKSNAGLIICNTFIKQEYRKKKARQQLQTKIDSLLTVDNLKKAWNSKESKKFKIEYDNKKRDKIDAKINKSLLIYNPFE